MRPELRSLAATQGGLVTRRQAVACGYTERELRTLTGHRGRWVVVRRGVYVERSVWEPAGPDLRYALEVRAALLTGRRSAVASHGSAAVLLGLPMRPRWREVVHVTRPGVTGSRTEGGVKHHLAGYAPVDLDERGGVPVLGLARTAVDLGREHGFEDGVVAADAALRLGARRGDLDRALSRMTCWPNITPARAAVRLADGGSESVGESLTRILVAELGLGMPETQFVIEEGRRHARVDLRLRRHLVEFDGKVKYLGRDQGGLAERSPEQVVWDEKQREDWLRGLGFGMSRVVWADLFGPARRETARRLARDIQRSDQLFGIGQQAG